MRRKLISLFALAAFASLILISGYAGIPHSRDSIPSVAELPINQFQLSTLGTQDYVDQISNLHAPADIGTHSSFAAEQAKDSSYDTLTEANNAGSSGNIGAEGGSGTSYRTILSNTARGAYGWNYAGAGTVSIGYAYAKAVSTTTNAKILITDSSDYILTNGVSQATSITSTEQLYSFTFSPAVSVSGSTLYHVYLIANDHSISLYYYSTTDSTSYYDSTNSYATPTDPTDRTAATDLYRYLYVVVSPTPNYRLDLEVGWTAADHSQDNEYLCIYTGSVNGENLKIDVWSGSAWVNVIASLSASQWNNISVHSQLTGSAFEIRFIDAIQTDDTSQSNWQIDCVLLHTWSIPKSWNLASTAQMWFNVSVNVVDWRAVGNAIICFWIGINTAWLGSLFVIFGLVLIPASTLYLAYGGRESLDDDKVFFFFILFLVGWALVLGGIMS